MTKKDQPQEINPFEHEMETVVTSDINEAAYLLSVCRRATVLDIQIIQQKGKDIGRFTIRARLAEAYHREYDEYTAFVNIADFRQSFIYVTMLFRKAKRLSKSAKQAQPLDSKQGASL